MTFAEHFRQEGRQEARQEEKFSMAKKLLGMGMKLTEVTKITGLTADEINLDTIPPEIHSQE